MHLGTWYKLGVAVTVCELAGSIGSLYTATTLSTWYDSLEQSPLTPPNYVFGPVWVTLYALMGVAAFLVWEKKGWHHRTGRVALGAFGIQLLLNTLWSPLFFGLARPDIALIDIVLLWIAIVWTMTEFYRVTKPAAYLLIPYVIWVTFAVYLNAAIVLLN